MDTSMKRSLDNWLTGGRGHGGTEELTCQDCGYKFDWHTWTEYGQCYFDPEKDIICPSCGAPYEEEE